MPEPVGGFFGMGAGLARVGLAGAGVAFGTDVGDLVLSDEGFQCAQCPDLRGVLIAGGGVLVGHSSPRGAMPRRRGSVSHRHRHGR